MTSPKPISPDGAHLGLTATQGLDTIMGGEMPEEGHRQTRGEQAAYLYSAPNDPHSYDDVARWAGGKILRWLESHQGVELPSDAGDLFDTVFPCPPGKSYRDVHPQIQGISGFMVGHAVNMALSAYDKPPLDNPAVALLDMDDGEGEGES